MRPLSLIFLLFPVSLNVVSSTTDIQIVYPRLSSIESKILLIEVGPWVLELNPESNLVVASGLRTEWVSGNGDRTLKAPKLCDHKLGTVRGYESTSKVVMTVCQQTLFTGYVHLQGEDFFLQPLNGSTAHTMYRVKERLTKRSLLDQDVYISRPPPSEQWLFNLTGDTFDIDEIESNRSFYGDAEDEIVPENDARDSELSLEEEATPPSPYLYREWRREQLDQEEVGYFYDTAWTANVPISRKAGGEVLPERWLEIAIAVDYTVIAFHGKDKVETYVLALMNIVNAIYQDASLNANMKLIITRLVIYEHKKQSAVRPGNAKKSLENVNGWNNRLHAMLGPGESRHDVAVWLTRLDIGGPSGYAPVGGVCDPKRSCALNRDEGLSSAFIIAHEMAHVLGLSHDGDKKHSNYCDKDGLQGSVMAPLVTATFNKFSWSDCSRQEFKKLITKWSCLTNPPDTGDDIILNSTLQNAFSMDEQCRMEFGEGYILCRAFDIIEPCSHLWCGHEKSPLVCKTKKGSPLEGTKCGLNKWCMDGYCQDIDRERGTRAPVILNPQNGGWSKWTPWGTCSRSCGTGVQFQTRKCDNPKPLNGGKNCAGMSEKWKVCNKQTCPEPLGDIRAQQCKRLPKLLDLMKTNVANLTWLPYESDDITKKCKLICISEQTKELFETFDNLIDGTPCSYENSDHICVQGICHFLGCDNKPYSNMKTDSCGVCGGNNSTCATIKSLFQRKLKREVSRVAVLPRMATKIKLQANATMRHREDPAVAFILKNRRKKKYRITVPNTGLNTDIIEGTKFYYERAKNKHRIWAQGPVLAEMVILVYAPASEVEEGLNVSLSSEYTIDRTGRNVSSRFKWILGGWGSCSQSCGGGRRQQTVACWDTLDRKLIRRKHCSLTNKPALKYEKCNEFDCNFQWIAGEWEPCSSTCGLNGFQDRELYCVPQTILNNMLFGNNGTIVDQPWRYMVNPKKCSDITPPSRRACNREPCFSYWTFGEWSQCSVSCAKGFSVRSSHCPPPYGEQFFTCGEAPSERNLQRICYGQTNPACKQRARKPCLKDRSMYCSFEVLSKYCAIGGFRRMCCKSCYDLRLISSVNF